MVLALLACNEQPNPFADKCDVPEGEPNPCEDPEGGAPPTGVDGTVSIAQVDTECTSLPAARHDAAVTAFYRETPIEVADGSSIRYVQHGFLMIGGDSYTGDYFDDMWMFDAGALSVGQCPWLDIGGWSATGPIAYAAMVFAADQDEFLLTGGRTSEATGITTSDAQFSISADTLSVSVAGTIPDLEYPQILVGDASSGLVAIGYGDGNGCELGYFSVCPTGSTTTVDLWAVECAIDPTNCCSEDGWPPAEVFSYVNRDPCTGESGSCGGATGGIPECADDPVCTDGVETVAGISWHLGGLAELAGAHDPLAGTTHWFGGTFGASGSEATSTDLWDLDGSGNMSLTAVNGDPVLLNSGGALTIESADASFEMPSDLPPGSIFGRRGAAAAVVGPTWDHDTRSWIGAVTAEVLVGGTRHQDLGPGIEHQVSCVTALCSVCLEWDDEWNPLAPAFASEADGLVPSADAIVRYDDGDWAPSSIDIGERTRASVAAVSGDDLLVIGGRTASGDSARVYLLDLAFDSVVAYQESSEMGSRAGAALSFDPVTRTSWLFGGQDDDQGVYSLTTGAPVIDGAGVTWSLVESDGSADGVVHASIDWDGTTWTTGATQDWKLECEDACFVERLDIALPTTQSAQYSTFVLEVKYPDETYSRILESVASDEDAPRAGQTTLTYRLPRLLTDGDTIELVGAWTRLVADGVSLQACEAEPGLREAACRWPVGTDFAWHVRGLPFLPAAAADASVGLDTVFSIPEGETAISAGTYLDDTHFGRADGRRLGDKEEMGPVFLVFDTVTHARHVTGSATHGVDLWWDSGMAIGSSAAKTYFDTTSGDASIDADLAWLEGRLGAVRNGGSHVIWLRAPSGGPSPGVGVAGHTEASLSFQWPADSTGALRPKKDWRYNTVHELAHQWLAYWNGHLTPVQLSARWLSEGLPTMMGLARVPDASYFTKEGDESVWRASELAYHTATHDEKRWCETGTEGMLIRLTQETEWATGPQGVPNA